VLSGALAHRDSLGNGAVMRPGDVQRMTAGTGVLHSEHNASATEPVHLLQIWLRPEQAGLSPGYEQRHFTVDDRRGNLRLVASRDGRDGSLVVHQDVSLHAAVLDAGQSVTHPLSEGRHAWLQVARGGVEVNGTLLTAGDAAAISEEAAVQITATEPAELLLFDLT
jgi:redox-sensitive bicupin YhaK (pirin superfamily)